MGDRQTDRRLALCDVSNLNNMCSKLNSIYSVVGYIIVCILRYLRRFECKICDLVNSESGGPSQLTAKSGGSGPSRPPKITPMLRGSA